MSLKEKVLNQIKHNKLENYDLDFVIAQVCVLNNKPFEDMKNIVEELIREQLVVLKLDKEQIKSTLKENKIVNNFIAMDNVDIAYDILKKKDKRANRKRGKLVGKLQGTSKGYAFLICEDINQQDVFISERNLRGAMHGDTVSVELIKGKGRREEGKVVQVLERANDNIVGKINFTKHNAFVTPDDVKFGTDIFVPLNKTLGANNGDKVVVTIEKYYPTKKSPDGRVVEVLGAPNKIETEILALIRSYKLYETFPKNVQEAAQNIPQEIDKSKYGNRLDYTKEITFTIDGEDTRDIDDAISLTINNKGNYVLGVHIADVGEYVKRNSPIDKEAFKRGTSVYFPNLVLPMLPRELSNGICSLNERVDRLTLSVFIEYDKNFNRVDYKVCESIINSKKRFTYTEIQKIFDGDSDTIKRNEQFVTMINNMRVLASELAKQRRKRGAIEFDIPEVQISLNELGDVLQVTPRENNESHRLIESFMVAANEAIAEKFLKAQVPFVYRVHETPDGEKVQAFLEYINGLGISATIQDINKVQPYEIQKIVDDLEGNDYKHVVNRVALRSMRKAKYTPECLGHFGLASTYYCHFTSPIRRYPDLTIHRIIKDSINERISQNELLNLKQFVISSSMNSSEREVNAEKVERDVDDLYRVFYMQNHVGEDFEGVISGVTEFGIFVELNNTVEGLVKIEDLPADRYIFDSKMYKLVGNSHSYTIGDRVKVKTLRADILSREVDFMLI